MTGMARLRRRAEGTAPSRRGSRCAPARHPASPAIARRINRLGAFRIEERLRRCDQRLHKAAVQPAYRRPFGPVDLDLQEIVALDPARPGRADLRQCPARQLENREGRILDVDPVRIAGLVAALGQRSDVAARNGCDLAQQAIENVAPVREHIEDQPAAGGFAIIPARPLRRVGRAVEYPPAEIEPDRKHSAEEIGLVELAQFGEPRQEQFVLHNTVFETGALGAARQIQGIRQCAGERLFDIDVLAGIERRCRACRPTSGRARVEIHRDVRVGETGLAINAPFEAAICRRQSRELRRVAAKQYRLWHEAVAIGERQPALTPDRHQRAQMLRRAEPTCRALYNDADRAVAHRSERGSRRRYYLPRR